MVSTVADPPAAHAASKPEVRAVATSIGSSDCTVAIALPA
jgi:hypothetical protein